MFYTSTTWLHPARFKAALINIFRLTMDNMSTYNVRGAAHRELSFNSAVPLSSVVLYRVFQLIVSSSSPLINPISNSRRKLFSCPASNSMQH